MNNAELQKEYELVAPLCEQFGRELTRQLEELLLEKNISLGFPLQYRVKTFDSVAKKIERASLGIQHIQDLNDLIGLRIILLFRRDVEFVRTLIKKNLKVFSEEDTQSRLGEGEFGYSSVHYQIGLQPSWKKMPTFKRAGELRAEIQVRTVAQHIWAAASHIMQYKQEANVPPPVRRSIHRVSALLETVDLEFERVLDERGLYRKQINTSTSVEELNVDLLAKILDETLPKQNKTGEEDYSQLLKDLLDFSIRTPQQIHDLLKSHLTTVLEQDKKIAADRVSTHPTDERASRGCYWSLAGVVRNAMSREFGSRWTKHQELKEAKIKERLKARKQTL